MTVEDFKRRARGEWKAYTELFGMPRPRVRCYTHWTQVHLAFGDEKQKARARKWLKRRSRRLRKARRGWA